MSDSDHADHPTDAPSATEDRMVRRRVRRALASDGDEVVPKLPRGRGFKLGSGQLLKIGLTGALLAMLIVMQRPCADSVSSFVTGFDDNGSAAAQLPKPGTVDRPGSAEHYELIHPNMTEAERKAAIERELARARAGSGSGSGSAGSDAGAGSGSAQR